MTGVPSRSAAVAAGALVLSAAMVTGTLVLGGAGATGCHHPSAAAILPEPDGAASADASDAEAVTVPARCRRTEAGISLGTGHELDELEIGDAVAYSGGYAVGLVRRTALGRVASVALLHRDPIGLARIVDLGPTLGDAPPPRLAWRAPELVAAAYVRLESGKTPAVPDRSDTTREVALSTLVGDAVAGAPFVVAQQRDDSLALDLAFTGPAGLLVWDEATSAPRGVIRAAAVARDHVAAARDLSPADSDAELPRVVSQGTSFAVVWIARRPEPPITDAAESEATGEPRAYGWLEMVSVDEHGEASGPVRRLTPAGGHVSAFDLETGSEGGLPTLVVAARDDGESVDGSGGAILRVRVKGDVVEAPVAFATDGLGRGAPTFVSSFASKGGSAASALAWVGKDEDALFLPLDPSGSPTARPSVEDGWKDARPLGFLDAPAVVYAGAAAPSAVLVASLADDSMRDAAELRVFACGERGK